MAAASRREVVGNAGYEVTLTVPKSISLYAATDDPERRGEWLDVMETAATRALDRLMEEAGFCSTGHRGDGQDVRLMPADGLHSRSDPRHAPPPTPMARHGDQIKRKLHTPRNVIVTRATADASNLRSSLIGPTIVPAS